MPHFLLAIIGFIPDVNDRRESAMYFMGKDSGSCYKSKDGARAIYIEDCSPYTAILDTPAQITTLNLTVAVQVPHAKKSVLEAAPILWTNQVDTESTLEIGGTGRA